MDFKVFKDTVENDGEIKAIVAKGAAEQYTRKDMDALTDLVFLWC
ncbi:GAD domain-containing protein [Staphylococcus aureus]